MLLNDMMYSKKYYSSPLVQFITGLLYSLLPLSFLIFGIGLLLLILTPILELGNGFYIGEFFFNAFHLASLYLPLYFISIALLLYARRLTYHLLHLLNWCFVPFVTLALALKTAFTTQPSILEKFLLDIFPEPGATVIMTGLFVLELIILGRLLILADDKPVKMDNFPSFYSKKEGNPIDEQPIMDKNFDSLKQAKTESSQTDMKKPLNPDNDNILTSQLKQYLDALDSNITEREISLNDENNLNNKEAVDFSLGNDHALDLDLDLNLDLECTETQEQGNIQADPDSRNHFLTPNNKKQNLTNNANLNTVSSSYYNFPFKPLLSDEEQEALHQVAVLIEENSEEENKIAHLIQNAAQDLDNLLENAQTTSTNSSLSNQESTTTSAAQENSYKEKSCTLTKIMNGNPSLPPKDYTNSGYSNNENESSPDFDPNTPSVNSENKNPIPQFTNTESHKKPFVSLFKSKNDPIAQGTDLLQTCIDNSLASPYKNITHYKLPIDTLLAEYQTNTYWEIDEETTRSAEILEETLREFNIEAQVTGIQRGPVITMFEILPAAGVKLSRIEALSDNIAFRLAASRVRIVAPIPGKQAVGIEIPSRVRTLVSFKEMLNNETMFNNDAQLPIILGKDIAGNQQIVDLARMPHLLIAGSTGAGKSVCINAIICSILFSRSPKDVRMILIDPKVIELKPYNDIPHLLTPVITENSKVLQTMQWLVEEMERRYRLLDTVGVRNIRSYNKKIQDLALATDALPYLVIIIDEFADLIATCGKDLESLISRLAAKSRAAGIHLIIATQRPSVDVITGLIKANFPSRIAFMVASKTDSRIILDTAGAEQLLGKGDMLFISSWNPFPIRIQGAYLSEEEVENVATFVKTLAPTHYIDDEIFIDPENSLGNDEFYTDTEDPLYNKAVNIVLETSKTTASYLQRRLRIGYNRAARLVDTMENRGVIGPSNGTRARDILCQ